MNVVSLYEVENKFDVSKYNTPKLWGRTLTTRKCAGPFVKLFYSVANLLIPGGSEL